MNNKKIPKYLKSYLDPRLILDDLAGHGEVTYMPHGSPEYVRVVKVKGEKVHLDYAYERFHTNHLIVVYNGSRFTIDGKDKL